MTTQAIRDHFVDFFVEKNHQYIPSVPLPNQQDPNLLFINAGMNPFAGILLGNQTPTHPRVVNSQPCLRVTGKHNDLEEVGIDTYHHTLFEMLGNWSFGDYSPKEAIGWAWELLTEVYKIPASQLYATVFKGASNEQLQPDRHSLILWQAYLPSTHIIYGEKKDNFWEMGPTGPCGPCTEIHIDLRSAQAQAKVPGQHLVNQGHPHVIELWNLVFIMYYRQANSLLKPLSKQHVDTGMGLERLAMVLQNKKSTYDTDNFAPLITWLAAKSGRPYGHDKNTDRAMRVIADHIRAISFAIADGQLPNTQRGGYVIRRILRRAMRYGYSALGFQKPFLYTMIPLLVDNLGRFYPRLQTQATLLQDTLEREEHMFLKTLSGGLKKLYWTIDQLPKEVRKLDGKTLFELYDTFGFPPDLTGLIAQEKGYQVDQQGFQQAMEAQQKRAKKATTRQVGDWQFVYSANNGVFVGYDTLEATSHITQYRTLTTSKGTYYQLVLDQTPFYPEGGGQVGDTGFLIWNQETIEVIDTQKEHELIIHVTKQLPQRLHEACISKVDATKRIQIESNHTATHLLHAALQSVLGKHVVQKGSLVHAKGFRFDFTHDQKIDLATLQRIEAVINAKICANIPLQEQRTIPLAQAKRMGAMALFGEKYGDQVRVITFDPTFSVELCGGTHVQATGRIGLCILQSETGIAAGIRRIEATTGATALQFVHAMRTQQDAINHLLCFPQNPMQAVKKLITAEQDLRKALAQIQQTQLQKQVNRLVKMVQLIYNIPCLIQQVTVSNAAFLKRLAFALTATQPSGIIVLGSIIADRVYLIVAIGTQCSVQLHAHEIIQRLVSSIAGKGGGKAAFAMASGKNIKGLPQAFEMVKTLLATEKPSQKNPKSSLP